MRPDLADDAELLRAHGGGDAHAFARLYDRHDRSSFHFIRRMAGAEAADDLHQETWLAVARNAASFDPHKAGFRAWLFTIARRKVVDHLRRMRVVVPFDRREDEDVLTIVPDPGPGPLQQLESRELAEKLIAAVEALPLDQRSAFILFEDAGLSLGEIAEVAGVTVETAKSRLRYARARLRTALAEERPAHV